MIRQEVWSMHDFALQREVMIREQLLPRGIRDERVLDAMAAVPREAFVLPQDRFDAYRDGPLPIGCGQTISQPLMVAEMLQAARIGPGDRVLEVGAGSGYAAAVLAQIADKVFAIERQPDLTKHARDTLGQLGYTNIDLRTGDGSLGLPKAGPFNAIIVSAGGPAVPEALLQQLAFAGRLVMPVGESPNEQELVAVQRNGDNQFNWQTMGPVRFVPLVGSAGWETESIDD